MNLEIEKVLETVKKILVKEDLETPLLGAIEASFVNNQNALNELIQAKKNGEISEAAFQEELEREKKIQEAELLTLEISAKAQIQKIMNKVFDVLLSGLK
jgi:hypothetical protein